MAEAPLSELCSICYTNPPKYRCPRCAGPVRTCSLPCYKRHQQRASCNGQRDPTAYVKKSQLATPAGIDHDYNFLSAIERSVGNVDKDVDERGIHGQATGVVKKRWHEAGPLQKYLRDNRIRVDRAPTGMSRQKANQTRYLPKSKKIVWSVEWVDTDGERRMCEVPEGDTLGVAYAAMLAGRDKEGKKRKRAGSEDKTARPATVPRADDAQAHGDVQTGDATSSGGTGEASVQPDAVDEDASPAHEEAGMLGEETIVANETTTKAPIPPDDPHGDAQLLLGPANDKRTLIMQRMREEQARQAALHASTSPPPTAQPPYYYLLKAHTPSSSRVLIPLSASESLTASLCSRVVLEFPTIYVLLQPPDQVPHGFLTEKAYFDANMAEDAELEGLLRDVPGTRRAMLDGGIFGSEPRGDDGHGSGALAWDERKILDMLKRDVPA